MFKKSDMDKSKFKDVELPEKELLNLKSKLEYEYFSKIKHLTEKVINLHLKTNKQLLDINCTSSSTLERYCNILHPHKNTDTAITRIKIIIESLEFIFFKKKNGVLSVKTKEELSDLINNNWEFSYTVYYWDWTNKAVEEGELKVNEDWNVAELTINNPKTKFKHIYEGNLEQTTTTSIFFNLWDYSNEEIGIGLSLTLYIGLSRKENRKFLQGTFSTIDRNVQMPVCGIVFAISTEPLKEQEDIKEIMVNNLFYKTLLTKSKVLNSYEETTDINSWKNLKNILDKKFEGFFIKPNSIQNDNTKLEKCTLIFGKDSKVTIGFLSGKTILGYCHIIGSGSLYIQFDYQLHERYSRFCMIFSTEISTLDKWYYGISSGLISNKSQPFINRIAIREINESTDINFEPFKIVDSKEKANEFFSKEERLKDF